MARTTLDMEKDKFVDGNTRTPSVRVENSEASNEFLSKKVDSMECLLLEILTEMKKLNTYMAEIADEDLKGFENDY